MLDTNVVIAAARGEPAARRRLGPIARSNLRISALTEAELLFGVEQREPGTRYADATLSLLSWLEVLPWNSSVARTYASARARQHALGRPLARVDMLIAAHALAVGAVLVSRDQAFRHVPGLELESWED